MCSRTENTPPPPPKKKKKKRKKFCGRNQQPHLRRGSVHRRPQPNLLLLLLRPPVLVRFFYQKKKKNNNNNKKTKEQRCWLCAPIGASFFSGNKSPKIRRRVMASSCSNVAVASLLLAAIIAGRARRFTEFLPSFFFKGMGRTTLFGRFRPVPLTVTEFYWVLLGFTGFYRVSSTFRPFVWQPEVVESSEDLKGTI